ncbi:MAG: PulJ/GspJ family protein [Planctomycetota bacterium]|jgi:prepilin-type N-terminal cleavage/methylation domain-containing protein
MITVKKAYSLIEVVICVAILSVILTVTSMVMLSTTDAVQVERSVADTEGAATLVLNRMIEELREAYVVDLPLAGSDTLTFMVPVDHDGDTDTFDANMDIEWGARRADGTEIEDLEHTGEDAAQTFKHVYTFVQTGTYDEAVTFQDINQDGDTADTFSIGRIDKQWTAGTVAATNTDYILQNRPFSAEWVIQIPGNATGDIDGDGDDDPIFFQNGNTITINLFIMKPEDTAPIRMEVSGSVGLRNPQQ